MDFIKNINFFIEMDFMKKFNFSVVMACEECQLPLRTSCDRKSRKWQKYYPNIVTKKLKPTKKIMKFKLKMIRCVVTELERAQMNGYDGSYLSNFLANTLRSTQVEINTDARTQRPVARLKEPRDLFALPKEPDCAQEAARWPSECQVIDMRVQHIDAVPQYPEAYYQATGKEVHPKPVGEEDGTVVFHYTPMSAVNYFSRSTIRGNRFSISPYDTRDLKFESRFESGNLAKAVKITDTYYELSLRTDLYTNRHVQWFYFMVENTKKGVMYRFSIVNLSKGDSLYNSGMKPVLYSTKDAVLRKMGWRRCGHNIAYYRNDLQNGEDEQNCSYTLSFNLEFPYDDDCVYIAHSYPYTYTDLQEYLIKLQNHPVKSAYTKLRLLCKTLAGNNVYYLTVTEPPPLDEPSLKKKKAIVITARVHPGETPASWMMKGVMDFITGDSKQAKELREKFIFKLIPMLNPDGVIVGNNRCSLTGRDLNRQYRTVIRETYPPVWHTKLMIRRLLEDCGVAMYCDLHAHSRKHNVFIYGCENKRCAEKKLQEQVFPLMLHKNAADKFSFENCKFRIQRSKEGTGRVVVWMMGVPCSYTMEASFAGSTLGGRQATHFSTVDYESMGRSFCETLLDFVDEAPSKEKLRMKIITRLQKEGSNADEPANISLSDYSSDEGDESDLSDEPKERSDDFILTAPPPSPASPDEKIPKIKGDQHISQEKLAELFKGQFMKRPGSRQPSTSPVSHRGKKNQLGSQKEVEDSGDGDVKMTFHSKISLKQTIWTLVPSDDFQLAYLTSDTQGEFLRSCSEKLYELKKSYKHKIKKKTMRSEPETEDTQVPETQLTKQKKKIKRRTTRVKKSDQHLSGMEDGRSDEALKIRPLRVEESKKSSESAWNNNKPTKSKATKKFRKGGIVATATVQSKNIQVPEYMSADESTEKDNILKKKKKKRKLQSIQKQMKSVIRVVTSSKSQKKDNNKDK